MPLHTSEKPPDVQASEFNVQYSCPKLFILRSKCSPREREFFIFFSVTLILRSRGSSVGKETRLRAGKQRNWDSVSETGRTVFSKASRLTMGLTKPRNQWVKRALSPRSKAAEA